MKRGLAFLVTAVLILFLNSCAGSAILVGGGGALYALHKEAKAHYPDKVPDLPEFPDFHNLFKTSVDKNKLKSSAVVNPGFGFDCTKEKNTAYRSGCFDRFAKSFSEKDNNIKKSQKKIRIKDGKTVLLKNNNRISSSNKTQDIFKKIVVPQEKIKKTTVPKEKIKKTTAPKEKIKKTTAPKEKIEESAFFEDVKIDPDIKKLKIAKEQQVAQVLPTNLETSKLRILPQKIVSGVTTLDQSSEFAPSYLWDWVKAWVKQDINSYLSFYSKDFAGTKRSRSKWEEHRRRALENNSNISIDLSNIQIHQSKIPVEVNFTQRYKSDSFSDIGIKELIWTKNEHGWKIIKETWIPRGKTSLESEANKLKDFVSSQLLSWVNAWGNQNINLYMSFYSKNFIGTKRSRSEWEAHRRRALNTNSNISIQVSNIQLHQTDKTVEVNFTQLFKSDSFSDVGIKELVWKKMGSNWKILKETWIPS